MKLRERVLKLTQECSTPPQDQELHVSGKYVQEMLVEANWFRDQIIVSNERNKGVFPPHPVPDKVTAVDLAGAKYLGRPVVIDIGSRDYVEVV